MKQARSNTPNYLKYLNSKKILQFIRDNEQTSRADIAAMLAISKPTVSSIVDELISEEWVLEKEGSESSVLGGRKPVLLTFNPNARLLVGVDIGGTNIEVGIVNAYGTIIARKVLSTQYALKKDLVYEAFLAIQSLVQTYNIDKNKIMAVGVGAPGITDSDNGIVLDAPSLGWKNFELKKELQQLLKLPVYVENDVNVAVLGEQWKGKAKNADHLILITLGTGVGCGIIVNGQLYRGASFAAGEIGYMVTDKNEALEDYDHIFQGFGFLDSHVGGPSIVKRMEQKLATLTDSHPLKNKELSAKLIFEHAITHDPIATEVIEETLEHIAFALVNVICIFNPQCVILGGGLSKSGQWFLPKVKAVIEKHLPMNTDIYISEIDGLSLLGAGALVLREHESLLNNRGGN
ncbi:ROK family transcriptional regulator [Bacillus sp. FJAT-45066]|uniref:ROK family transcriptional regulator n=1 Tax=Bacillus sp. FJAT-45066 TaxID=2011010 RepID=UPI000BB7D671|nr:ROK family transcriptional regulator [Bacillus sp. FJAT-45066]